MSGSLGASRRVVAIVPELLLATRIAATAQQVEVGLTIADGQRGLEVCRSVKPDLIVLDLEALPDPAPLIRSLKSDPFTSRVPLVGFYPHVRNALRAAALGAGADRVLPRSAFIARLGELLAGEPGTPE
jgi:CheY-like chemotaxis protein